MGGVELLQAWFGGRGFARHRHDTYAIGVTEAGLQMFDYRGRVERGGPGDVVVLHPDEAHDGRAGGADGFGYRIVYVEPARIAAAVRAIRGRPATPAVRARARVAEPDAGARGHRRVPGGRRSRWPSTRWCSVSRKAWSRARTDGRLATSRRLDHAALDRARACLEGRRAIVRSAELEAVTGLSRYELARQFRDRYGTSPYRYSLMRRLDFARHRLHAATPLADLALAAGFADQAHFTRMFRSAYGVTPGRYARLCENPRQT